MAKKGVLYLVKMSGIRHYLEGLLTDTNKKRNGEKMEVLYRSTRSLEGTVTASQAILKGLAEDGGLFVPQQIPALDVTMDQLA